MPKDSRSTLRLTSELVRAARALLRLEQRQLSEFSEVSLPTIKRLEAKPGPLMAHASTEAALRRALEAGGIEFIEENGGGPGVRFKKTVSTGQPRLIKTKSRTGRIAGAASRKKKR